MTAVSAASPKPAASRVRVAVPVPLRRVFDYTWPFPTPPQPGSRVEVPFGRRKLIGVVVDEVSGDTDIKLKAVLTLIDPEPVFDEKLFQLLLWASDYYHHPVGEVLAGAMPVALRKHVPLRPPGGRGFRLTPSGVDTTSESFARAKARAKLFDVIAAAADTGVSTDVLRDTVSAWTKPVARLVEDGLVEEIDCGFLPARITGIEPGPALSEDQLSAVAQICACYGEFACCLLHGVTGSGKTEVYIGAIRKALDEGKQALVLVPEIALTPQLVDRLANRLGVDVAVLHSGLADGVRHRMWFAARTGEASVVLGTRSAIFAPLANPGLIVIDEEHDGSYKQQDGFRYHARDVAIMRARALKIPVVLGSATPSLESIENARRERYRRIDLPSRVGSAGLPEVKLLDMSQLPDENGLTPPLIAAIEDRLARKQQSLIFLNRRGFSPVLICGTCRWQACCERCDARLTHHRNMGRLRCHHCGLIGDVPEACPACEAQDTLVDVGVGTQRVEEFLETRFPEARLVQLDTDATRGPADLEAALNRIRSGDADIIVGTQMVAKGHDFPGLTLVGIVNADQGLYSIDFRASEFLVQQITQVTGRAGRADAAGEVLVQTAHPTDPAFKALAAHDYDGFILMQRDEREAAGFPPFSHLALMRSDSTDPLEPTDFLAWARRGAMHAIASGDFQSIEVMDPVPSPMERRNGRFRAQLLVRSTDRGALHRFLREWIGLIESNKPRGRMRWSVDVDPLDLY